MSKITRREFMAATGMLAGGLALSSLGVPLGAVQAYAGELSKAERVKQAQTFISTCDFCSVSCGLLISSDAKTKKVINIEGDPEHPISEGALCAKGAAIFQESTNNPDRLKKVLYRAPYSTKWETKTWDWALDTIAQRIKAVRDKDFITTNAKGQAVNRLESIAHIGSSKMDNEECWLASAMLRSLGLVNIDHQARV